MGWTVGRAEWMDGFGKAFSLPLLGVEYEREKL